MKPIKILYSQWGQFQPIEIYIEKPAMGEIYFMGQYVRFKAHIDIKGTLRHFDLNMPLHQTERAFESLPVDSKNCQLLKIIMQKETEGKLNILDWEIIK